MIEIPKMKMPTYLKDFNCIQDKCEDSCCSGFTVPIDKYTFDKYENVESIPMKNRFSQFVKKNPKANTIQDYGYINAICDCPFLEEGLCSIQKNLGESYLSTTCSKYPKHIAIVDKILEKWATLSCPEIARLVLLNPQGVQFEDREEEIDPDRDTVNFQLQTSTLPITSYFYELREFTIQTLQNREYPLEKRMNILKNFYKELNRQVLNKQEDQTLALIEDFKKREIFHHIEEEFPLEKFLMILNGYYNNYNFGKRYKEVVEQVTQGFSGGFVSIGKEFLEKNEYILENYLVNYVFQHLFPFSFGENMYEPFRMLELHYVLLTVHIMGVGSHKGEMDTKEVVRVVQSFVKEVEHNTNYLFFVYRELLG